MNNLLQLLFSDHDVSSEKRDSDGKWTENGESNPKTYADEFESHTGGFSPTEEQAVMNYSHGYDGRLNNILRQGETRENGFHNNAVLRQLRDRLDSLLNRRTLHKNTVVYRGMYDSSKAIRGQLTPGAVLEDKGFISTSLDIDQASKFGSHVTLEIRCEKDSHAAAISNVSNYGFEHEVLLPRGSRFKVISVTKSERGSHVIVELLPEKST